MADSPGSRVAEVDKGFVPVSPGRVFELVRDPSGYPGWWPGVRAEGGGRLRLPVLGSISVATERVRDGKGLLVTVSGKRAAGHLEWYLEPFKDGTIVYGITDVRTTRRWSRRRVLRHRTSMRRALVALKERL